MESMETEKAEQIAKMRVVAMLNPDFAEVLGATENK